MNDYLRKKGEEKSIFEGKMIQVIHQEMEFSNRGEINTYNAETARRAPGIRAIIVRNNQILLTKELRPEIQDWDFRLAGGKVFDSLEEYLKNVDNENVIKDTIIEKVLDEVADEARIIVKSLNFYAKSILGSSMQWDLYYYEITDFEDNLNYIIKDKGEIIYPIWKTFEEAIKMCYDGSIKEERSAMILLRYFKSKGFLKIL